MRLGFFGTPNHSAKLLKALVEVGHEIIFVVTNIDKPAGREKKLTPPPVKILAQELGLNILQFVKVKEEESIQKINSFDVDLNIVFAFGQIIPRDLFDKPRLGTINLHGSILPAFRGASPIQAAILEGKSKTGISIQYITEELDAGNLILTKDLEILEEDNSETLLEKMTDLGIQSILELLQNSSEVKFPSTPQQKEGISFCKKIKPEDRRINWSQTSFEIHNKIRAYYPNYICFTEFKGKRLNIIKSSLYKSDLQAKGKIGSIHLVSKKDFVVECANSSFLQIEILQPDGKREMQSKDFINGNRITDLDLFV
jgi:methionyl-tRNA formyltransferase